MNRTTIDWGFSNLYTWNPVVGCKRNCYYCYAKKIHVRFNKTSFNDIQVKEDRLFDRELSSKKSRTIFVGSMSDIEYWPNYVINHIIVICREKIQHTFMFLSKDPESYVRFTWPKNCILGLTLEGREVTKLQFQRISKMLGNYSRIFFSIEPLLGSLEWKLEDTAIERVIVGPMSGPGKVIPKKEWIQSIKDHVPEEKIYWKKSIRKYL